MERPALDDPYEKTVAAELRRNFTEWQSAEAEFLHNAKVELDFLSGKHWVDEQNQSDKQQALWNNGRSAYTIDLLSPSVDLVVNQIRINKLTANFIPLGEGADVATADIRQGLYRNIDRVSHAAIARETGYQFAVSVGRGYERILIEDEDGPTFRKKITIQRVDNLHSIAMDPTCLDFACADAQWGFAFDDLWKDEFKETFGEDVQEPIDSIGLELTDDDRMLWFPKDKVRVGEYFRKVWKRRDVWKLEDGTECWKDEAPDGAEPVKVKSKLDYTLEWRRMTGTQTLEKRVWPGKRIPIVVFVGREIFRGTKRKINSGMVRPAMAPSIINNYMTSRMVDEVALSPLPHMQAVQGQFTPDQKRIVNSINSKPWSVVEQTPMEDSEGRQLPLAQWVSPSPNIGPVVQAQAAAKDDLERVLNIYAPQRGAQVGDTSGKAINAIKDAGDVSHAAFPDNFNRSLTYEAEVVNELMDVVYTDPQAITITQPDEKTVQVLINQEYQDKRTGKKKIHIFGQAGSYGVEVGTGPAYPSRIAEAVQHIIDLVGKSPEEMSKCMDLVVGLLVPGPIGEKFAARFRPPGFSDPDEGPDISTVMQQRDASQQQLQQADKLIQMLMQKVKELGDKTDTDRLKIFAQMHIAAAKDRSDIIAQAVKAGEDANHMVLQANLDAITDLLNSMASTPIDEAPPASAADPSRSAANSAPASNAAPLPPPAAAAPASGLQPPPPGLAS